MATITIQTFLDGRWHDAAAVELADPQAGIGAPSTLEYDLQYWIEHAASDDRPVVDERAVSVAIPVSVAGERSQRWHSFLLDLIPQGNMRRKLAARLGLRDDHPRLDFELLKLGAGSPVGNVRVKEAHEARPLEETAFKGVEGGQMLRLEDAFLDVWERAGLSAAGSEGVQGEWPKIMMTRDREDGLWYPDPVVPDDRACAHYLMKRAKSAAGERYDALAILQAEPGYLELARRFGLRVAAPIAKGRGVIGVPRFDRVPVEGGISRVGQESIVSALGVSEWGHGGTHEAYLGMLKGVVTDPEGEVVEYVLRDLLNMAAGNPDNHGRNTAIQKFPGGRIALAPVFDFAPMRRATEGGRVTKWSRSTTSDHAPDWVAVAEAACAGPSSANLLDRLRAAEPFIRNLPDRAREAGVDEAIIEDNIVRHVKVADALAEIPPAPARKR